MTLVVEETHPDGTVETETLPPDLGPRLPYLDKPGRLTELQRLFLTMDDFHWFNETSPPPEGMCLYETRMIGPSPTKT